MNRTESTVRRFLPVGAATLIGVAVFALTLAGGVTWRVVVSAVLLAICAVADVTRWRQGDRPFRRARP